MTSDLNKKIPASQFMFSGKEIETPYIKLKIENGIIIGRFADDLEMDLDIAKHCVEKRIELCGGIPFALLADMRGIRSISKEAREYLAVQGAHLVKAGALLTGSWLTRTLANIFLSINRPAVPTKMFTDEAHAIEWLKKYE